MTTVTNVNRKNETRGRVLFILLTLVPIVAAFIIDFSTLKIELAMFVASSIVTVVVNQVMSKTFRKNNPQITDNNAHELMQDKNFNPAMVSRVVTFAVSILGSMLLAAIMNGSSILHPILFFLVGYVYFTMIQFKRL